MTCRPAIRSLLLAAALALLAAPAAEARRHDAEKLQEGHIRDLHFGDVLFLYFQSDDAHDFEALTRVLAYQQWGRMPHYTEDAQLIAGSLYLQQGMHNEAGDIFERLLTNEVSSGVRNRAWLYLAQIWYDRGYLDKAEAALRKVNGRMSPELEAQKELLFANVLMHQGHYDEAIQLLSGWRGGPVWSAYARFNLGVALVKSGEAAKGSAVLDALGREPVAHCRTAEHLGERGIQARHRLRRRACGRHHPEEHAHVEAGKALLVDGAPAIAGVECRPALGRCRSRRGATPRRTY